MTPVTPSVPAPVRKPPAVPPEPVWRLSVEQYHAMARAGILTDDDPVELLEGWLVPKVSRNPPHRAATRLTSQALAATLPAGWYVDSQGPITLADSEPEPDVVVVRGETRDYLDRHPGPADLALVVEVADTALQRDRETKLRLYAQEKIAVYWIVNLAEGQVEVYTKPSGPSATPGYASRQDHALIDVVPVVIAGAEVARIPVRDLVP